MTTRYRYKFFRISFFIICVFLYFTVKVGAQPLNYTFTALTGTYTPLPSPNLIICCGADNFTSAPITIPFAGGFNFGCANYTEVVVTENGWFTFDPNCW